MTEILSPVSTPVEDHFERMWSDPEALQDACIAVMDAMLERDGERLAAVVGISARQLRKQRERRADLLRKQWLHRLADLAHATFMKFGPARTAPIAQLFARAAGHELASALPPASAMGNREAALALMSRAVRESCDAAAKLSDRAEDGLDRQDARALLPEVDEALQEWQAVRSHLLRIACFEQCTEPGRTRP